MKLASKVAPMKRFVLCCIIFLTIWVIVGNLVSHFIFPTIPSVHIAALLVVGGWLSNFGILISRAITKKLSGE